MTYNIIGEMRYVDGDFIDVEGDGMEAKPKPHKPMWTLQGNSQSGGEWLDLYSARRIKDLPKVNQRIAKAIGAIYRVVLK